MNRMKKILSLLLSAAMVLSMATVLSGCGGDEDTTNDPVNETGEKAVYTVSLQTAGGMALSGIDVYVYAGSDLKQFGETNESGQVTFEMVEGVDYSITLSGVPKGYDVAESYSFDGTKAIITLTSSLIEGESLAGATFTTGDVMYDFSVTTPAGETVTLSQLLEEKELVVLNFWYTTCTYCIAEFPFMEEAYQMYQDDVAIIALNPFNNASDITTFQQSYGLSFYMAECPATWASAFGVSGYPTSVFVDRYGVICLIEAGGILSLRPFTCTFDHFTSDKYVQKLCTQIGDLVTAITPTYEMESSETIAETLGASELDVTFRGEEGDEMSWPFITTEKNGEVCLKASNQQVDDSYAILYADIYLEAGQAIGFDYLASSEQSVDILYVLVDGEAIYNISGTDEKETWKSAYPWVALEDGYYELALCYLKDESDSAGDDTVYVKNLRVVSENKIDTTSYIPRYAYSTEDGFDYSYVEIVYNSGDGYYHVGSKNGPLLLANLMGYTEFNEEETVYDLIANGKVVVGGYDYYEDLVTYCSFASNSSLYGYCTVNQELAELLQVVSDTCGFSGEDNEWLKLCSYYQVYGPGNTQLTDPVKGLAPFSAYTAKLGTNVSSNYFYYDRAIIPRGLLAKFVPTKSGVYRITSENSSNDGVEGWIFDSNRELLYTYAGDERMFNEDGEVSMVFYMKAGEEYYIDIAFWDVYEVGYIYYDIEYLGSSYDLFRACAPSYFTYDGDATGDNMYYLIHGGIDVVLGTDGYYYEDLGKDASGKQLYGSKIYCDFSGINGIFDTPIATTYAYDANGNILKDANGNKVQVKGLIDKGAFDFSKTEDDMYILAYMAMFDNDVDETDAYLRELWGEDYDTYAEAYQLQDVYAGRYHGTGKDYTAEMQTYLSKMISGSGATGGCVPVTERLAELLQMLMDKYTFENVEDSWIKLCYYYDHLG